MAHRSRRRAVRNPVDAPEYQEELLRTGIPVFLDLDPAFMPSLRETLDILENGRDSVVNFVLATGRFDNSTPAMLVFPDKEMADKVRFAAMHLAGDMSQSVRTRVRAMDLKDLIERGAGLNRLDMEREEEPPEPSESGPGTTALATRSAGRCLLTRRPTASTRKRGMRLLTDAHGDAMRGLFGKFPDRFQEGYKLGWEEYDGDELDEEAGDRWGQHIHGFENGLWTFSHVLEKAGFETQVYDVCGCGDPLHQVICFRRPGETILMAVRVWDGLWHHEYPGSGDLNEEFCQGLADGSESLPDDAWEVAEVAEIDDDEWEAIRDGLYNNPGRSVRRNAWSFAVGANPDARLWRCPSCRKPNAWNWSDAQAAADHLGVDVAVAHGSCFDNICGHCGADVVKRSSPIRHPAYTHQGR